LKKIFNVKIFIFINSNKSKISEAYQKQFPNKCEIVLDRLGLYSKQFGVKKYPFLYLISNTGKILQMNKIGSLQIDKNQITQLINQNKEVIKNNNKLKEINRINLNIEDKPLISNKFRNVLFCKKDSSFYLCKENIPFIFKVTKNGTCYNLIDSLDLVRDKLIISYDLEWWIKDSILFSSNLTQDGKYSVNMLNINKLEKSQICKINQLCNFGFNFIVKREDSSFIFTEKWKTRNPVYLDSIDNFVYKYDFSGNLINTFGKPDSIYMNNKYSCMINNQITSNSNHEIFLWLNILKKIQVYNFQGEIKKEIQLDFDSSFHYNLERIPEEFNDSTWKVIRHDFSLSYKILVDNVSPNSLGLIYYNYIDKTPNFPGVNYDQQYYMNILNTKTIKTRTVKFPINSIPFYFEGDKIFCTEVNEDNELSIVYYQIVN